MKNRILFLGNLSGGGLERRMSELIRSLHERGDFEIHLMLTKGLPINYSYTLNYVDSYKEIDYTKSRLYTIFQVWSYIRKVKPQIVHGWSLNQCYRIVIIRRFLPQFYFIAGFVGDGNKEFYPGSQRREQEVYRNCDIIVSNSKAGLLSHNVPSDKSLVIYNGFNSCRIPSINKAGDYREELCVNGMRVVMMVARMDAAKDYNMFIDAIKIINQHRCDIKFLFCGHGPDELSLKKRVTDENVKNVVFLGFRKDVEYLLQITDLSVLCSSKVHNEGVSNSILESLAMGIPVIATRSGGTPEIVEDGENGYVIECGDSVSLANKIEKLLDDNLKYEQFSLNARKTINGKFTINKMVGDYIKLYQTALNH